MEISDPMAAAGACDDDSFLHPLLSTKPKKTLKRKPHSRLIKLLNLLPLLFWILMTVPYATLVAYSLTGHLNHTIPPRFQLASAIVFPFNFSGSAAELNTVSDFTLRIDNPNLDRVIYYDDIQGSVLYRFVSPGFSDEIQYLALKSAPFFVQEEKETTWLLFRVRAHEKVLDGVAADQLAPKTYSENMKFKLRLVIRCRYKIGNLMTREKTLQVACNAVNLAFDVKRIGFITIGSSCEVF